MFEPSKRQGELKMNTDKPTSGHPSIRSAEYPHNRTPVFAIGFYFFFAVAHWIDLSQMTYRPMMCGNVYTDPVLFLLNNVAPVIVLCVAFRTSRLRAEGRRSPLPILALPVFGGTTLALLAEAVWMNQYGLPVIGSIWWLPSVATRALKLIVW